MPRKVMFKVVGRDRKSCYAGGYQAVGRYCKIYSRGTKVTAEPGTLGLMTFPTRQDSEAFIKRTGVLRGPAKILRVLPVGRGKKIRTISGGQSKVELDYFYKTSRYLTSSAPPNTMGYPAVEVLN